MGQADSIELRAGWWSRAWGSNLGALPAPACGWPFTTFAHAVSWALPSTATQMSPLWEFFMLMPHPPAHLGREMLIPGGAVLPVPVLDCELCAGAGRACVCLSAVSFWCPVTVTWVIVGTDKSRVPSPAHSPPMAPRHLEPQSSSPSAWHPRPLPASRSPSLKEAPVVRTMSSAQSTLSSATLHLFPWLIPAQQWPSFPTLRSHRLTALSTWLPPVATELPEGCALHLLSHHSPRISLDSLAGP